LGRRSIRPRPKALAAAESRACPAKWPADPGGSWFRPAAWHPSQLLSFDRIWYFMASNHVYKEHAPSLYNAKSWGETRNLFLSNVVLDGRLGQGNRNKATFSATFPLPIIPLPGKECGEI
jgi:hypothetical protein